VTVAGAGITPRRVAIRHGWTIGIYLLMMILLWIEVAVAPAFTSFDLGSLVIGTMPLAFAAMAQATVVISGGIDLSVGSVMALINVASAKFMEGEAIGTALLIAAVLIVMGALIGASTGLAVTLTKVPDIVVTLATSFIWGGVALLVLREPGGGAPIEFTDIGGAATFWEWIPNGAIVIAVVLIAVWLPIRWSKPGYAIYAIGSNREAAHLSGVNVARTQVWAYTLGGVFAALGGLSLTATTGIGSAYSGEFYTLNSVAAVVLGGVSLLGGKGGLAGPVAAAFCLTIIIAIMTFMGVDPNYAQVIQGGLIVLVVMAGGLVLLRRRA
jgi:ribose transport system permease protein